MQCHSPIIFWIRLKVYLPLVFFTDSVSLLDLSLLEYKQYLDLGDKRSLDG